MAFGGFSQNANSRPIAEINMIPLIDVMLVLLVIFIVTAPLLTHAVKVDLPRVASQIDQTPQEPVRLAIGPDGEVNWNGESVSREELSLRLHTAANRSPQPELHILADQAVPYRHVAEVMAEAGRLGLTRIGFVTDPRSPR
ncbi:outer membrane transport energization protein ExbD [Sulfuritortus calidifontis]|uniref:Outer membrane transport energization protein ExbD n=1 Tax=Sulfuritortus calidifontis TaxID=1914471 RepID=A0A4R3JVU4_9PROT|nr:biopolymer transporter ExbD [Sulfuritortus calidifontis]TCS70891.1 outer membrane transport energization protein ExbD [Sulfuritortus calidifontis]